MGRCTKRPDAEAWICGGMDASQLSGCIRFYQEKGCVLIEARVSGLPESETGFFGFHIHQGGSCAGDGLRERGAIMIPLFRLIRNTQEICRRCCDAREPHICLLERIAFS